MRKDIILPALLLLSLLLPSVGAEHILQVNSGDDDATERGNGFFADTALVTRIYSYENRDSGNYRCAGYRFENVPIGKGEEIENAFLSLYFADRQNINATIYGENVDDSVSFTTLSSIIDNVDRPKTENSLHWAENGVGLNAWENSDNISHILQEIIDRPGWVKGNDITIFLIAENDQTRQASVRTYEFSTVLAAKITLHWQPSVGVTGYPLRALPKSVINIRQFLESHGQEATSISAIISFSDDNFFFLENTPENDAGIDNCPALGCVYSEWFVSTPDVEGTYSFFVDWEFIHNDQHFLTSDNYEIIVSYSDESRTVLNELEKDFIIFFLIFLNMLFITVLKLGYLQIFIALCSSIVAMVLNGTSVFPWLNIMLITVALFSIVNTWYKKS